MNGDTAERVRTVRLDFDHPSPDGRKKPVRDNLSGVAASGNHLWFGTDEGTSLDRLTVDGPDRYGAHAAFDLRQFLRLPVPPGKRDEVDIEGLAVDGDHLWLVGSHAWTRDKADPEEDGPEKAIEELEDTDPNPNRRILARIPLPLLQEGGGASPLQAAQLAATKEGSALLDALAGDKHFERFLAIPAKENGFDIEGLAVREGRVVLGLRGPVLRGWAVLLELGPEAAGDALELGQVGPKGRRYRKHFLDLEGCGVRDLCFTSGGDLLVLAGPTMALDGAVRVHRWTVPDGEADTITTRVGCPALLEVPHRRGADRAEGMVLLPGREQAELLVVYDSPAPDRQHGKGAVDADVFVLPV